MTEPNSLEIRGSGQIDFQTTEGWKATTPTKKASYEGHSIQIGSQREMPKTVAPSSSEATASKPIENPTKADTDGSLIKKIKTLVSKFFKHQEVGQNQGTNASDQKMQWESTKTLSMASTDFTVKEVTTQKAGQEAEVKYQISGTIDHGKGTNHWQVTTTDKNVLELVENHPEMAENLSKFSGQNIQTVQGDKASKILNEAKLTGHAGFKQIASCEVQVERSNVLRTDIPLKAQDYQKILESGNIGIESSEFQTLVSDRLKQLPDQTQETNPERRIVLAGEQLLFSGKGPSELDGKRLGKINIGGEGGEQIFAYRDIPIDPKTKEQLDPSKIRHLTTSLATLEVTTQDLKEAPKLKTKAAAYQLCSDLLSGLNELSKKEIGIGCISRDNCCHVSQDDQGKLHGYLSPAGKADAFWNALSLGAKRSITTQDPQKGRPDFSQHCACGNYCLSQKDRDSIWNAAMGFMNSASDGDSLVQNPECIKAVNPHLVKADVMGLGATLIEQLGGGFDGPDGERLKDPKNRMPVSIFKRNNQPPFPAWAENGFSPQGKKALQNIEKQYGKELRTLLEDMVKADPNQRPTSQQALDRIEVLLQQTRPAQPLDKKA